MPTPRRSRLPGLFREALPVGKLEKRGNDKEKEKKKKNKEEGKRRQKKRKSKAKNKGKTNLALMPVLAAFRAHVHKGPALRETSQAKNYVTQGCAGASEFAGKMAYAIAVTTAS